MLILSLEYFRKTVEKKKTWHEYQSFRRDYQYYLYL